MALTRKLLKSLGLEESVIETIIDAHSETVDALKLQRDEAIAASGAAQAITQERDQLKQQLEQLRTQSGDVAAVRAEYDAYKQQVETERAEARDKADVLALLREAGIQRESFLQLAAGAYDRSQIQRGEDGSIINRDALIQGIKTDYADCIATTEQLGTPPTTPPTGGGKTYTRDQIRSMSADEINANWAAVTAALAK